MHHFDSLSEYMELNIHINVCQSRVLARIIKIPVYNSNFKCSARPDLATQLLKILITSKFDTLSCLKGQFTLQPCHRRWFVRKMFDYYPKKVKIEKSSLRFLPV